MNAASTISLLNGNKMPVMGLGTWKLTGEDCLRAVSMALELGYRMIDTASNYHNHQEVGQAIKSSRIPRNGIFLTTKVEENDDAFTATQDYLEELQQKYADLMLIHWPPRSGAGEQLWRGLIRARNSGLAKNIGVSNYTIEQMKQLIKTTGEVPAVNQIEWSPFGHSMEMLRFCRDNGIIIQAYSPLTHGERFEEGLIHEMAQKYGKTAAQIVIRWDIQHKIVPVIKATSRQHLKENIGMFDFEISNEDMRALDGLNEEFSALGGRLQYV